MQDATVAGVELGGTKTVMVLARGGRIVARESRPTEAPGTTLPAVRARLEAWAAEPGFAAIGIASFGPIRVDPRADDCGHMLATPKPGWSGIDVAGALTGGLGRPWRLDTDVNAAALAEHRWGAGRGMTSLCYLTIGTGVGGGLLVDGRPVHGALHPEIGHLRLRRAPDDAFPGICPFHRDCIEGLVSGPALAARFGRPGDIVPDDHPGWAHVAHDLGELVAALALAVSPQRILIGGGVGMGRGALLPAVSLHAVDTLRGYLPHLTAATAGAFVAQPALGADAGPLGAAALALDALGGA